MSNPLNVESIEQTVESTNYEIQDQKKMYRLFVELTYDEENPGYTIQAMNLLGAISEGDTEEEAIANIQESAQGIIDCCKYDLNESIPWKTIAPEDTGKYREVILDHTYAI